jgi:hypothetical protein
MKRSPLTGIVVTNYEQGRGCFKSLWHHKNHDFACRLITHAHDGHSRYASDLFLSTNQGGSNGLINPAQLFHLHAPSRLWIYQQSLQQDHTSAAIDMAVEHPPPFLPSSKILTYRQCNSAKLNNSNYGLLELSCALRSLGDFESYLPEKKKQKKRGKRLSRPVASREKKGNHCRCHPSVVACVSRPKTQSGSTRASQWLRVQNTLV